MRLVAVLTIYVLGLLLAATSPIGTGQGVHRDQLLDPIFPHVHPDAPRSSAAAMNAGWGPALGAGSGADSAAAGAALAPPLPDRSDVLRLPFGSRLVSSSAALPASYVEAPPDPPPDRTT
jgi:hypothetical protein